MAIRIMLVDDHKILRDALKGVLEREHDIVLVGEANDGAEALKRARELHPEIILMDVGLPIMGGIEVTRAVVAEQPETKVIALSTFSDRRIVLQMLDAGASGYVVKSAGRDELLRAIRSVAHSRTYLCPDASAVLVDSVRGKNATEQPAGDRLGRREREVLQLLAEGHTSPEIGTQLHIATSTVEVHRRNIMRKLELHSIAELTKYAIRNGLTST
jgi:DNA-binding NarL/FixJ family response regulator